MSQDVARQYNDEFTRLQRTLNSFVGRIPLDDSLEPFEKIVALWDDQTFAHKSRASRLRYRAARNLLHRLFNTRHDIFFLCCLALSITRMGLVKERAKFCQLVEVWITERKDNIPESFRDHISKLFERHRYFFQEKLLKEIPSNIKDGSETEHTSHDVSSQHDTPSEDVIIQDSNPNSVREGNVSDQHMLDEQTGPALLHDIEQTRPASSHDIEQTGPALLQDQKAEIDSFKSIAMNALKHSEIYPLPTSAICALSPAAVPGPIYLSIPGDSRTRPFMLIPFTQESAYHILKFQP